MIVIVVLAARLKPSVQGGTGKGQEILCCSGLTLRPKRHQVEGILLYR